MAGRPHYLDDPDHVDNVAMAFVNGCTREQMCTMFNVTTLYTITRWKRDPRVKARAAIFARDRILQVVRKTDTEIERRLQDVADLKVSEILEIRKNFITGPGFEDEATGTTAETVNEITEAIEANPEFAADLEKLLSSAKQPEPQEG